MRLGQAVTHAEPGVDYTSCSAPAAEGRGGISGCSYLLEILARRSAFGLGGVIQIQVALDGLPQVVLGITAGPAMLASPVMVPVGGVHSAQVAQRRRKFLKGARGPLGRAHATRPPMTLKS